MTNSTLFKERPLNNKEINLLNQELKLTLNRKKSSIIILAVWTSLAVIIGTLAYFFGNFTPIEKYMLVGCTLVYVLIGVWNFIKNHSEEKRRAESLKYSLAENKTRSLKTIAEKYIELPEKEDEGTHYLFQLNKNEILSFGGPDFSSTKKFPSNNFEIALIYGKSEELVLMKIYSTGEKIKPVQKINGQRKWDLMASFDYPDPERYTIIAGNLEDFVAKLENN